jgi:hypothetical protein
MKIIISTFFFFFLMLGCTLDSQAALTSVGIVRSVSTDAFILRDETSITAKINMKIMNGDVVKTGPNGSIGLIFDDDTIVSIGPNSEFAVEDFIFNPLRKIILCGQNVSGTFPIFGADFQASLVLLSGNPGHDRNSGTLSLLRLKGGRCYGSLLLFRFLRRVSFPPVDNHTDLRLQQKDHGCPGA